MDRKVLITLFAVTLISCIVFMILSPDHNFNLGAVVVVFLYFLFIVVPWPFNKKSKK